MYLYPCWHHPAGTILLIHMTPLHQKGDTLTENLQGSNISWFNGKSHIAFPLTNNSRLLILNFNLEKLGEGWGGGGGGGPLGGWGYQLATRIINCDL